MMVIDFLPAFNSIMGSSLSGKNIDSKIIFIFTGLVIFTLLFTSLYQSWRLARISPVEVLNKKTRSSVFYAKYSFTGLSQFLSVSQIIISMILIVSLITINKQTSFLMNHKLGFNKSNLILFKNPWNGNNTDNYRLLKDAMNKLPGVKEVATSWNSPGENISNYGIIELVGADKENRVNFGQIPVDAKFLSVVEADFLWGRNFNPSLSSDTNKVVINKFGMDQLALIDPAGRKLRNYFNSGDETYEIIGVVDNIQYQSLREKEKPVIYFLSPEGEGNIIVRLNSLNNMETIDKLKKIWAGIEPDYPFHYEFIENIIQTNYRKEIRSRSLLSVMAYFAIAISMLGIFGLGIFMSQKRTKEIGIRKVNGATIWEIIAMLNKEFVKWVLIAFVIATPGSWFVMHKWLENFVYKTELSWWIFALSGALVLIIALLTVSWKSWQAATRNPVEALRYE
jgi:putative ABC transport system permease protein